MTIWDVFASVVDRHGDRIAVEVQRRDTVEQWTYRALQGAAEREGAVLEAAGVEPGDRCAILADHDGRWCAAYLAILRCGAIAVPVDTNYSVGQVAAVIADATPRVLFASERLVPLAREAVGADPTVHVIALVPRSHSPAAALRRPASQQPSATAVVLYTAGTTSNPKGVMLSHATLLAARHAVKTVVNVHEDDSVLGGMPLFHAPGHLAAFLLPLAAGARVVMVEALNSAEMLRALAERRVTVCACGPQFLNLIHDRCLSPGAGVGVMKRTLLRARLAGSFKLRRAGLNTGALVFARARRLVGSSVRLFVTSGGRVDPAVARDLYALGFGVVQAYGLTETSGAVALSRPDEAHIDTVGCPLPGQQVRVLPSDDRELGGEIAIRGSVVMQGYFNRPDATAAAMQDGWLLTGDMGRLDRDGRLTITGRREDVIRLPTGARICPEEIEAQYQQSAYVKEVCVVGLAQDGDPATTHLYAVVVPDPVLIRERRIVNAGDLIRFEIEGQSVHLPPHKRVLAHEVSFEPLPRTTTGALKRREVERQVRANARPEKVARASIAAEHWRDEHARFVAEVVARHARSSAVRADANLELDLALDSMQRVELIAELEQRCGVRIGDEQAHEILTVAHLVQAFRPGGASRLLAAAAEDSWAVLLRELPPPADPVLGRLLQRRRVMPRLFFAALRLVRWLLRVEVVGLEHLPDGGPFLLCPNHQSYLDPFFVCGVLPYATFEQLFFVGATEYFESPLTAWTARQFNLVPVDPDANLVPAMRAAAFGLAHGKILVLFPEGERSIDGSVKRFKKGAPILARHIGAPIIPVAVRGSYDLWPRNRPFNWRLLVPGSGHRVRLSLGPPLRISPDLGDADAAAVLRGKVAAMWENLETLMPTGPAAKTTS